MSKTKAPTGLSITRSGSTFTFSWKIGDSDYANGQNLQYSINGAPWQQPAVGKTATSFAVAYGWTGSILFQVRGNRKKYRKNGRDVNPGWSSWASAGWWATVPAAPAVSYEKDRANSGTFSWSVAVSDTDTAIFSHVEWQTCIARSNAFPPTDGWSGVSIAGASGSVPITEETEEISAGSLVRWFRVRSVGPAGVSVWMHAWHAYGIPAEPVLDSASALSVGTHSRITAQWRGYYDLLHPIDEITVQYCIDTPVDNTLSAPVSGWDDAVTVSANGGYDTKKPLFEPITNEVEGSARNNFARAIFGIIAQNRFDFSPAFAGNFDFYWIIFMR